ncbi:YbhB/YbcL family Raf kinase inhibitor-like protein [Candidatus Woesearchaeota archaeon]|jgi:hypothetical protein|nr:YbhB/YbcL family Raf kinase inhibitor-like protein [Candidatus Woesearchaeota archaeon]MDP6939095.1 YbhB/YbcL family Raf kinase inhibitor-like protein [Planctomycetota bacterium]
MDLVSESIQPESRIPAEFAFCDFDEGAHVALAGNRNPHLAWSDIPEGTKSFALVCHDPDVPSQGDDVNQEGREVPADLPRVDFFHWTLVDIAASCRSIEAGAYSDGVTPRGKEGPAGPDGTRQGLNDYTGWFAGDADMSGDYFGYDGPCPPWNDSIVHHYHYTLYALDVETCAVEGSFSGADVLEALKGHILAEVSIVGTYTLNPQIT